MEDEVVIPNGNRGVSMRPNNEENKNDRLIADDEDSLSDISLDIGEEINADDNGLDNALQGRFESHLRNKVADVDKRKETSVKKRVFLSLSDQLKMSECKEEQKHKKVAKRNGTFPLKDEDRNSKIEN